MEKITSANKGFGKMRTEGTFSSTADYKSSFCTG